MHKTCRADGGGDASEKRVEWATNGRTRAASVKFAGLGRLYGRVAGPHHRSADLHPDRRAVGSRTVRILSTTLCYPHPAAPTQGIFVQRRLAAIHRLVPLTVIAPQPWFPWVRPMRAATAIDPGEVPPTLRPRMFYLPGFAKRLDAGFYARCFERAIREHSGSAKPDLIDAHFEWPDAVGAWRVAKQLDVPFVCTLRGKLGSQSKHPAKRRSIRAMLIGANAIISVSHALAEDARRLAGADLNIRVIPNGIDRSVFHPGATVLGTPVNPHCGKRTVVSVGHLQHLKGFHRLVESWPAVMRAAGDVQLVLVGGDAGEPAYARGLRDRIESLGLTSSITLAGRLAPSQVAGLLASADLFALASSSEGWCNALAEALACGCPAVATDVGGNREILHDPEMGRLVPPTDDAALANAIVAELKRTPDRARVEEMGGRRDWQSVARECVDVWSSVLGRPLLPT